MRGAAFQPRLSEYYASIFSGRGQLKMLLRGHRGAVMSVAVTPHGKTLATASIDASIKLWGCLAKA